MIIGVDLDGVVFDSENYLRTVALIHDIENVHSNTINRSKLMLHDRYGWNDDVRLNFLKNNLCKVEETSNLMPCVKYVIDKLRKLGHKIICITARGKNFSKEIDIAKKTLKQNKIIFDKTIFVKDDKLVIAKDEQIDLMIDDNPAVVENLTKNGIKCLYFRDSGIRPVNNKNSIEVYNWGEVLFEILKMTSQK